jgi:hypothetical protein
MLTAYFADFEAVDGVSASRDRPDQLTVHHAEPRAVHRLTEHRRNFVGVTMAPPPVISLPLY